MVGYQPGFQPKLFSHSLNLEQKAPQNHILRKIKYRIAFSQLRSRYAGLEELLKDRLHTA